MDGLTILPPASRGTARRSAALTAAGGDLGRDGRSRRRVRLPLIGRLLAAGSASEGTIPAFGPHRTVYIGTADVPRGPDSGCTAGRARQDIRSELFSSLPSSTGRGENPADLLRAQRAVLEPDRRGDRVAPSPHRRVRPTLLAWRGHRGRRPGLPPTPSRPESRHPLARRHFPPPPLTARCIEYPERNVFTLYRHPTLAACWRPKSALSFRKDIVDVRYPRVF